MRIATDTGGTFTDLVIEREDGSVSAFKSPTTPEDPVTGVLDVLAVAADHWGLTRRELLESATSFVHGTTHAINAVITGRTARTALITTHGHRDILIMREGGRPNAFDHHVQYPSPYIPRSLTFEVIERVSSEGEVLQELDEDSVNRAIEAIIASEVEAVAVCLLWSIQNGSHERKIGSMLKARLPQLAVTLSHELNPVIREYRRASSASIDASLKPAITEYITTLGTRLQKNGYGGPLHILTSKGGCQPARAISQTPIQVLNSGPSMAPVAGKYFANLITTRDENLDIIVADTGGTTFDLSVVRNGVVPLTQDLWIGEQFLGHLTGFPSVDVTSIGAGGGSIAHVDSGGVLFVGPQSAGSDPGPACFAKGGELPTLTDAAVVLGYLDPDYFLGGKMNLDVNAANDAIEKHIARKLGIGSLEAAASIVDVATESMVQAIIEVASNQGIDVSNSILIGGGGAAGMNSTFIAKRLGCRFLAIPELGATLSAGGAAMADLVAEFRSAFITSTDSFDTESANQVLSDLSHKCQQFLSESAVNSANAVIELSVEARYSNQVWTIDTPLMLDEFKSRDDLDTFIASFHQEHLRRFQIIDEESPIEIVGWAATVRCSRREGSFGRLSNIESATSIRRSRQLYFTGIGRVSSPVYPIHELVESEVHEGPAIVDTPITTVVIDPDSRFYLDAHGSLIIFTGSEK